MSHTEVILGEIVIFHAVHTFRFEDGGVHGEVVHTGDEVRDRSFLVLPLLGSVNISMGPEGRLFLFQVMLLGSDDRTWSADAYPGDGFCGRETVMLHEVTANQSSCTA